MPSAGIAITLPLAFEVMVTEPLLLTVTYLSIFAGRVITTPFPSVLESGPDAKAYSTAVAAGNWNMISPATIKFVLKLM